MNAGALSVGILAVGLGALASAGHTPSHAGGPPDPDVVDAIGSAVDSLMVHEGLVGVTVAAMRGGEFLTLRAYGHADREAGIATSRGTVYRLGSLTKPMTAAGVLLLAERGALALDDRVSRWVPEWPLPADVQVRHLLAHTSGLPRYMAGMDPEVDALAFTDFEVLDLVAALSDRPSEAASGEAFAYSGTGYQLLGLITERAAGRPWEAFLAEEVLRPARVGEIRPCPARRDAEAGEAMGYMARSGAAIPAPERDMRLLGAAGGLCGTAAAVARWMDVLMDGAVLSPGSLALMTTPRPLPSGEVPAYALGLSTGTHAGHPYVAHGGTVMGFQNAAYYFPGLDLTVVVLMNTLGPGTAAIVEAVLAASQAKGS